HIQDRHAAIVGLRVGVQHQFHVCHELAIGLRRNHPVLALPIRQSAFFKVWRIVSWLIESTISNSTTFSANSRRLQLANPLGGGPNRIAMTWASCSPSSALGRGVCSRDLPSRVTPKPNVTNRSRMFSTVLVRQPTASAILASV